MLYLGIDQHRKQLTVSVRNEAGDAVVRRQVSTEWGRVRGFFDELRRLAQPDGGFAAIVEVCGFNDWLLKMLTEYGCRETVLIRSGSGGRRRPTAATPTSSAACCGSTAAGCWRSNGWKACVACSRPAGVRPKTGN